MAQCAPLEAPQVKDRSESKGNESETSGTNSTAEPEESFHAKSVYQSPTTIGEYYHCEPEAEPAGFVRQVSPALSTMSSEFDRQASGALPSFCRQETEEVWPTWSLPNRGERQDGMALSPIADMSPANPQTKQQGFHMPTRSMPWPLFTGLASPPVIEADACGGGYGSAPNTDVKDPAGSGNEANTGGKDAAGEDPSQFHVEFKESSRRRRKGRSLITLAHRAQLRQQNEEQRQGEKPKKEASAAKGQQKDKVQDETSPKTQQGETQPAAFCPFCGGGLQPHFKFCLFCGAAVEEFRA